MIHFYVYILYSKKIDKFYVGQTNNLDRRTIEHHNGESTYTRKGRPWVLVWTTTKPTRWNALKLEKKLKNLTRQKKIRFMLKYSEGLFEPELILGIARNN